MSTETTCGQRLHAADVVAAAAFERELRLVRLVRADGTKGPYDGARVLAVSDRTGHVYEGYSPYGQVIGWSCLLLREPPSPMP